MDLLLKKIANLLTVKSLVTIALFGSGGNSHPAPEKLNG